MWIFLFNQLYLWNEKWLDGNFLCCVYTVAIEKIGKDAVHEPGVFGVDLNEVRGSN